MASRAAGATPAGSGEAADPATAADQASGTGAGQTAAAEPDLPGEAALMDDVPAEALPDGAQLADGAQSAEPGPLDAGPDSPAAEPGLQGAGPDWPDTEADGPGEAHAPEAEAGGAGEDGWPGESVWHGESEWHGESGGQPADARTDDAGTDGDADTDVVRDPAGPDGAGYEGSAHGTGEPSVNDAAGRSAPSAPRGTRTQRPEGAAGLPGTVRPGALRRVARLGLRPAARRASWQRAPGVLFAAVTVLPSLFLMAWLLPGLPLLLAGRFADIPMIVISVPLAIALIVMLLRELPSAWPHGIRDFWDAGRAAALSEAAQPGAAQPATAAPGTERALSSPAVKRALSTPGVKHGNGAAGPDAPGTDSGEPEPGMDLRTDPVQGAPAGPRWPGAAAVRHRGAVLPAPPATRPPAAGQPADGCALVGPGRDDRGGGGVRRVAVRREFTADHRAA